jgi:hypothetical protein
MAVPRTVTITRRRYITDNTPTAFAFTDIEDAALSTNYESDPVTISGLIGEAAISVVGGTYSINGGAFVSTPGTVENGDEIVAAGTSPATNSDETDVTVTVGTYSDTFTIATVEDDTAPDQFTFVDVGAGAYSTLYESNTITVTGITSSAAVSIDTTGLSGSVGYSKNGGAYTTSPGIAVAGDTFKVRLTTGIAIDADFSTTLTIGGVSDTYTVTTAAYVPSLNFSLARNSQYIGALAA